MTGAGIGIGWVGVSMGCGFGASELEKDMSACISPKRFEIRDMEWGRFLCGVGEGKGRGGTQRRSGHQFLLR